MSPTVASFLGGTLVDSTALEAAPSARSSVLARLDEHPLYVIGGRQRADRSLLNTGDWYGYDLGVILRVSGAGVTIDLEYMCRLRAKRIFDVRSDLESGHFHTFTRRQPVPAGHERLRPHGRRARS